MMQIASHQNLQKVKQNFLVSNPKFHPTVKQQSQKQICLASSKRHSNLGDLLLPESESTGNKRQTGAGVFSYDECIDLNVVSLVDAMRDNAIGNGQERANTRDEDGLFVIGNYVERVFLVASKVKSKNCDEENKQYSVAESLAELSRLADTAGLLVTGQTQQYLEAPENSMYVGTGKIKEIQQAVIQNNVDTIIFDDELTPRQLRNLSEAFGNHVRVCDRTALILDIFSQRAFTKEGKLQVELAQSEYQLPRLSRMWSHLERQAGGQVKGMGEKQIEVDKRLLRNRMDQLREQLKSVMTHRKQHSLRRQRMCQPVVALVGYTNAGKSTLLNKLTNADVLAEDKLFATLDPTTRKVNLPTKKQILLSDTVGFIQKLPTQLIAAFRATLGEIENASVLLHVVDISHPNAKKQIGAVNSVLAELGVENIPVIHVWNKLDQSRDPRTVRAAAARLMNTVCVSGLTGEGMEDLLNTIMQVVEEQMVPAELLIPYKYGHIVPSVKKLGVVHEMEYKEDGFSLRCKLPIAIACQLEEFMILRPKNLFCERIQRGDLFELDDEADLYAGDAWLS